MPGIAVLRSSSYITFIPDRQNISFQRELLVMAGCVSWQEFQRCIRQLLTISDQLADGWTLYENKEIPEATYVVKKITVPDTNGKQDDVSTAQPLEEPLDDVLEDVNTVTVPMSGALTWEYHVLYSQSYAVPVLYFNAWASNGRLLSLEEMWGRVHDNFQDSLQENRWSVLTQQEHPVLRRPFFLLHPCRTSEFLDCFQGNRICEVSAASAVEPYFRTSGTSLLPDAWPISKYVETWLRDAGNLHLHSLPVFKAWTLFFFSTSVADQLGSRLQLIPRHGHRITIELQPLKGDTIPPPQAPQQIREIVICSNINQ